MHIQWVTIVSDIKQIAHRRLATISSVVEAQLTDFGYLPTEISCRRNIRHSAHCIGVNALIILREMRTLRHHLKTDIQVVGFTNYA